MQISITVSLQKMKQKNKPKEGLTAFFFLFILEYIEREKYES